MQLPLRMGEILAQAGVMVYDAKGIPVGRLYDAEEAAAIVVAVNERAAMQTEIERLQDKNTELRELLSRAVEGEDDECEPDHHGLCQSHHLDPVETCWVKLARAALDAPEEPRP